MTLKKSNIQYAKRFWRWTAYAMDLTLLFLGIFIIILVFNIPDDLFFLVQYWGILQFGLIIFYETVFIGGKEQTTLCKMLLGIKVVKEDGSPTTLLGALVRTITKYISLPFFLAIVPFLNSKKKGVHDYIAGTIVIQETPKSGFYVFSLSIITLTMWICMPIVLMPMIEQKNPLFAKALFEKELEEYKNKTTKKSTRHRHYPDDGFKLTIPKGWTEITGSKMALLRLTLKIDQSNSTVYWFRPSEQEAQHVNICIYVRDTSDLPKLPKHFKGNPFPGMKQLSVIDQMREKEIAASQMLTYIKKNKDIYDNKLKIIWFRVGKKDVGVNFFTSYGSISMMYNTHNELFSEYAADFIDMVESITIDQDYQHEFFYKDHSN